MERLTIRTNEASISFECESVGDIVRRLADIEDILGDEYDLDRLRELALADREGRCVVLPDGGYSDKDGETALKNAMFVCSLTNNAVNRYIADAIAEKLTREEDALRREQDGQIRSMPILRRRGTMGRKEESTTVF